MASTGGTWRLGRRPALDGLRGVAILLVVACHALVPGMSGAGVVGVTMFFTLSGFLITALLLEEVGVAGRVNLRRFYLRRARRLLPALVVFLTMTALIGALVLPALFPWRELPSVLFYVANLRLLAGGHLGAWGHTWSLAVEEQFYLLWPLALVSVRRLWGSRGVMVTAACGALAGVLFRSWSLAHGITATDIYFRSEMHADALLVGCALAAFMHRSAPPLRVPQLLCPALVVAAASLSVVDSPAAQALVVSTAVPLLTAAAIFCAVTGTGAGFLGAAWLRLVGRRSYALYLWNMPALWFLFQHVNGPWIILASAGTVGSWGLAQMSWYLIERRFLRPRSRRSKQVFPAQAESKCALTRVADSAVP